MKLIVKKSVIAPLGIATSASAIDAGIQEKVHGSRTTIFITLDEEMNDIMKIDSALEDFNIL